MNTQKGLPAEAGQSLYEMVAAIGVIGIALFALVSLATLSLRNANYSKNNQVAISLSQEGIEWLRAQRDDDWPTFYARASSGSGSTWCISNLTWSSGACGAIVPGFGTEFRREALLIATDANTVTARVVTSWTSSQGISDARVTTDFTGWR